jgi:hypothetical protein
MNFNKTGILRVVPDKRDTCLGLIRCTTEWVSFWDPEHRYNEGDLVICKNSSKFVLDYFEKVRCEIFFDEDNSHVVTSDGFQSYLVEGYYKEGFEFNVDIEKYITGDIKCIRYELHSPDIVEIAHKYSKGNSSIYAAFMSGAIYQKKKMEGKKDLFLDFISFKG